MSISASDDAAGTLSPGGGRSARSTGAASALASSGASTAATMMPSTFAPAAASPSKKNLQLHLAPSLHAPAPQAQLLPNRRPPRTPASAGAGSLRRQLSAASGLGKIGGASSPSAAAVTPPSATLTGLSGLPAGRTVEGGSINPLSRSGSRHRRRRPQHSGKSPTAAAASPFAKDTGSCRGRSSNGEKMHCASHPLDSTPTSLRLRRGRSGSGLLSAWPSSGRLHTVSRKAQHGRLCSRCQTGSRRETISCICSASFAAGLWRRQQCQKHCLAVHPTWMLLLTARDLDKTSTEGWLSPWLHALRSSALTG